MESVTAASTLRTIHLFRSVRMFPATGRLNFGNEGGNGHTSDENGVSPADSSPKKCIDVVQKSKQHPVPWHPGIVTQKEQVISLVKL